MCTPADMVGKLGRQSLCRCRAGMGDLYGPLGLAAAGVPPAGRQNASPGRERGSYSTAVAKSRRRCQREPDPGVVLARLRSPDPQARVRALHGICPCAAGFGLYERFRAEVKRLQKDPDPRVRAAALHVEHDACEIEAIEAGLDRADEQGWRYSDPGWVRRKRQRQATGQWLPL